MTISEQIREWREALGMTQAQLAAALDVVVRTVQNWESGVTEPKVSQYHAVEEMARKAREEG